MARTIRYPWLLLKCSLTIMHDFRESRFICSQFLDVFRGGRRDANIYDVEFALFPDSLKE